MSAALRHACDCVRAAGNRVRQRRRPSSNSQCDDLRQPPRPFVRQTTSSQRCFENRSNANDGHAKFFFQIECLHELEARGDIQDGFLLLHGEQRIDHHGMVVTAFPAIFFVVRRGIVVLILVAGGRMRPVAVIHLAEMLHTTAIAHEAAMQAGRLRPAYREKREQAEDEPVMTKTKHGGEDSPHRRSAASFNSNRPAGQFARTAHVMGDMSSFRLRPHFTHRLDMNVEEARAWLERGMRENTDRCEVKSFPGYLSLRILEAEQHYWSPQLQLSLDPDGEGALVTGTYGPNTNLWSSFVYAYLILASAALFSGILGMCQWCIGQTPWGLWILGVALTIAAGLYISAQMGQKLGAQQTFQLHRVYEAAIGREVAIS